MTIIYFKTIGILMCFSFSSLLSVPMIQKQGHYEPLHNRCPYLSIFLRYIAVLKSEKPNSSWSKKNADGNARPYHHRQLFHHGIFIRITDSRSVRRTQYIAKQQSVAPSFTEPERSTFSIARFFCQRITKRCSNNASFVDPEQSADGVADSKLRVQRLSVFFENIC